MARLAGQQIYLSISSFDSSGQTIPNAYSGALSVIRTTQVGGDIASHIEHLAGHENFLRVRDRRVAVLRPFHKQRGDTDRDEDGRSELSNARPIAWKRNRPVAHNFLRQSRRRFDRAIRDCTVPSGSERMSAISL